MASRLISDQVWESVRALLPVHPVSPAGGRPPIGDREVLSGVLFVLKTGISWEALPSDLGCGCGMTCLRRLRQWQQSGVWPKIQEVLKLHLRDSDRYDWARIFGQGQQQSAHASSVCGDLEHQTASAPEPAVFD